MILVKDVVIFLILCIFQLDDEEFDIPKVELPTLESILNEVNLITGLKRLGIGYFVINGILP